MTANTIDSVNNTELVLSRKQNILNANRNGNRSFTVLVIVSALVVVLIIVAMVLLLTANSLPTIQEFGFRFLTDTLWDTGGEDPTLASYGAAAFVYGTVISSLLALVLATPLAVGGAIFIVEYAPNIIGKFIGFMVELLVTIPSVVYGLWGVRVLAPLMRETVYPFLENTLGRLPVIGPAFFANPYGNFNSGFNLLTASLVLAIMILPTIFSVSREVIAQVPRSQTDAMLALGSTKWEAIRHGVIPYARSGIVGAALLGLARAIGETMAVLMLAGKGGTYPDRIETSLFAGGSTIASRIAGAATESYGLGFNAVLELGLVLILVASIFNIVTSRLVNSLKLANK